jgi:hypothetical protein
MSAMPRVLAVHGIAQQLKGEESLLKDWRPALIDGLRRANYDGPVEMDFAFYGDLFRRGGTMGVAAPSLRLEDLSEYEGQFLIELWREAACVDPTIIPPEAQTMIYAPDIVRRAFLALSGKRFITGFIEKTAILWFVNQVYRYFNEPELRAEAQRRASAKIARDTRVVVAHSLGSVVAYEALCAHPEWPVRTLVTIGSPLGVPNLVFERLAPPPAHFLGVWPRCVVKWTNISAKGDFVALQRQLATCFGDRLVDIAVDNESDAHDALRYLTAKETGAAIRDGLLSA